MSKPKVTKNQNRNAEAIAANQNRIHDHSALWHRIRFTHILRPVLMGTPLIVIAFAALWVYATGGRWMQTQNAYVKASTAQISAEISGTITALMVQENQRVQAGSLLFRLDTKRLKASLDAAQAAYNVALGQIMAEQATYRQLLSERDLALKNLAFARRELKRRKKLTKRKIVSESTLDEYVHDRDVAAANLRTKEQEIAVVHARLGNPKASASTHPLVLGEQARVDLAREDIAHAQIHAPITGTAGAVPVLGDYIRAGVPAMVVIADQGLWVEANFKETALTHMRPGQKVRLRVDAYPDITLRGHVASIDPATGAEFSLLPAQNASGNWVKVVQRIPVRIAINTYKGVPVLRAGMSVHVRIDTNYHRPLPAVLRAPLRWMGADVG